MFSQNCPTINIFGPNVEEHTDCTKSIGSENVKIYFHVWGNESIPVLDQAIQNLNSYFGGTGFHFFYNRCEVIYHTSGNLGTRICAYKDIDRQPDGINVHTLGTGIGFAPVGEAESIPGKALVIGGTNGRTIRILSSTFAHEVGHCLGLFHTHANHTPEVFEDCDGNCVLGFDHSYDPNDPDAYIGCGDYVADTNPDPALGVFGINQINACQTDHTESEIVTYVSQSGFCGQNNLQRPPMDIIGEPPPFDNIMSYSSDGCRSAFTHCQAVRMHDLMLDELRNSASIECCGEITLEDGSEVSDLLSLFPNMDLNQMTIDIRIDGTFIVEQDVEIPANVNFYMEDDARIIVQPGVSFTKNGGFIIACDEPFHSIEISTNANGIFKDCDIKGAFIGINYIESNVGTINNVGIYDCDTGIKGKECASLTITDYTTNARQYGIDDNGTLNLEVRSSEIGFYNVSTTRVGIRTTGSIGTIAGNMIRSDLNGVRSNSGQMTIGGDSVSEGNIIFNNGVPWFFHHRVGNAIAVGFSDSKSTISYNLVANSAFGWWDWQGGILSHSNFNGVDIFKNSVFGNNNFSGIRAYSGSDSNIDLNQITGNPQYGVAAFSTTAPIFQCNQIESKTYGLYIGEGSPTERIATNHFDEADIDLYLASSIGKQEYTGNWDWENIDAVSGYDVQDNYFVVSAEILQDPSGNSALDKRLAPPPGNYPSGLFEINPDGTDETCEGTPGRNLIGDDPIDCWLFDELSRKRSVDYDKYWVSTYQFLRHYLKDSDVSEWPIELWDYEPEMMTMLKAEVSYRDLLNKKNMELKSMTQQLTTDQIAQDYPLLSSLKQFANERDQLVSELVDEQMELLNDIDSGYEMFDLRREMFHLELKSKYNSELITDVDLDRLTVIADLCPEVYGDVVYVAQWLLIVYEVEYLPPSDPCDENLEQRSRDVEDLELISVYPNPAKDRITIESGSDIEGIVTVYAADGKALMTNSIFGKIIEMQVGHLSQGIYFIEIIPTGQKPRVHKIVIQK